MIELPAEDQWNNQQEQTEKEARLDPKVGSRIMNDPINNADNCDDQGSSKRGRNLAEGVEAGHRIRNDLVG